MELIFYISLIVVIYKHLGEMLLFSISVPLVQLTQCLFNAVLLCYLSFYSLQDYLHRLFLFSLRIRGRKRVCKYLYMSSNLFIVVFAFVLGHMVLGIEDFKNLCNN